MEKIDKEYRPRLVDSEILESLALSGAVVIEGPKACGKTMSAARISGSIFRVDLDFLTNSAVAAWPELVLDGETPRLIDEWQTVSEIWNRVRRAVDDRGLFSQFILTGSASPADDITRHSGAGRFSRLRMRTLTTFEAGESTGAVSLGTLLEGSDIGKGQAKMSFDVLVDLIVGGGWPTNIGLSTKASARRVRNYLEESTRIDVAQPDTNTKGRDPRKVKAVIQSLARGIGSSMAISTIRSDVKSFGIEINEKTIDSYLDALQRVMLIDYVPAWAVHLRSSARLRTKPKHYFADPSLAVAVLNASPELMRKDLRLLGLLFENLVMRDLFVYAQHNNAEVSFYRDSNGLEVDAIIEQEGGNWIAVEIKLGSTAVDDAAESLKRFAASVDTTYKGEAAALVVVTGNGYYYKRDDGVIVVPLGALGA